MKKQSKKTPLMYKGYIIRKHNYNGKYCAYSYKTDYFINPIFDKWENLKKVIDNLK
tara:strand:- start:211 stop:378 length:168 start_codon:yes stop_codon:yes gene_type:complete